MRKVCSMYSSPPLVKGGMDAHNYDETKELILTSPPKLCPSTVVKAFRLNTIKTWKEPRIFFIHIS